MTNEQEQVKQFHELFDCVINKVPTIPDSDTCELRVTLMKEEFLEVVQAIAEKDISGVAKELADLMYVVLGTAVSFGIDLEPIFKEVHTSNITKVGGYKRDDGKWVKPDSYIPPDIDSLIGEQSYSN